MRANGVAVGGVMEDAVSEKKLRKMTRDGERPEIPDDPELLALRESHSRLIEYSGYPSPEWMADLIAHEEAFDAYRFKHRRTYGDVARAVARPWINARLDRAMRAQEVVDAHNRVMANIARHSRKHAAREA